MDNHKVYGSMIYLCCGDNFGARSFFGPLNEPVRLRGRGSHRNGQSSKLIMVFFRKINIEVMPSIFLG